jgi:hypothetical protein
MNILAALSSEKKLTRPEMDRRVFNGALFLAFSIDQSALENADMSTGPFNLFNGSQCSA